MLIRLDIADPQKRLPLEQFLQRSAIHTSGEDPLEGRWLYVSACLEFRTRTSSILNTFFQPSKPRTTITSTTRRLGFGLYLVTLHFVMVVIAVIAQLLHFAAQSGHFQLFYQLRDLSEPEIPPKLDEAIQHNPVE